jgi:hypothetical protein
MDGQIPVQTHTNMAVPLRPSIMEVPAGLQKRQPPPWADADACFSCKIAFGFFRRKHHCRHCGNSFCDADSQRTCPLPMFGLYDSVRVCEACFDRLESSVQSMDGSWQPLFAHSPAFQLLPRCKNCSVEFGTARQHHCR